MPELKMNDTITDQGRIMDAPSDENPVTAQPSETSRNDCSSSIRNELEFYRGAFAAAEQGKQILQEQFNDLTEYLQGIHAVGEDEKCAVVNCRVEKDSLSDELGEIRVNLHSAKESLESANKREEEIKKQLKLEAGAKHEKVMARIQEYREGRELLKGKLEKLATEYETIRNEKKQLSGKIEALQSEKYKYDLAILKQTTTRESEQHVQLADSIRANLAGVFPRGPRPDVGIAIGRGISLTPRSIQIPPSPAEALKIPPPAEYDRCLFCKEKFPSSIEDEAYCFVHRDIFKDGKYHCCGGAPAVKGCLRVRHIRLYVAVNKKLNITDGNKSIEIN